MTARIARPTDNYDIAGWNAFYVANPHLFRSVGAEGDDDKGGGEEEVVDQKTLPEGLRKEAGKKDAKAKADADADADGEGDGEGGKKAKAKEGDTPKLVRVRINGKSYDLPEDVAEDLLIEQDKARTRTAKEKVEKKAEKEEKKAEGDGADDLKEIETLIFTNPREALTRFGKSLAAQITGSLRSEYTRDQAQAAFWNDFYAAEGKHLKKADRIVKAVMADHMDVLSTMTVAQAKKTLADLTDKELQSLLNDAGYSKKIDTNDKTQVEGTAKTSKKAEEKKVDEKELGSLSAIVKKRQEARRKATFSKGNEAA